MPYDPDCQTDARVLVNGTRLPAGDVDVFMRKEGPLDLTRYAEVRFASPWRGEDYAEVFGASDPDSQGGYDTVRIDVRDTATGNYSVAFRGNVTGVGNTASGPSQMWKFRAEGPGHFVERVPASVTFESASAESAFQFVVDQLDERIPFTVELASAPDGDVQSGEIPREVGGLPLVPGSFLFDLPLLPDVADAARLATRKTFQANKHTLADVVAWASEKAEVFVWLAPTAEGVALVATPEPTRRSHEAHYLDGNLHVVNNDALAELNPVNTLVLKGKAARSLVEVGDNELNRPARKFHITKARHSTLYQRAGETELHAGVDRVSDAEEKAELESAATTMLKRIIDDTTAGTMQTLLRGPVTPYDTVTAQPACDGAAATGARPLTYEVSRVHHAIDADGISQTELHVGPHTTTDDIAIVDTWKEEA